MPKCIRVRRGAKINLKGVAEKILNSSIISSKNAISPTDFTNLAPKLLVKEGDSVAVGTSLFFSKTDSRIQFVSPVSGTVESVVRGAKRKILEIVINISGNEAIKHKTAPPDTLDANEIKAILLKSGGWSFIQQRPYGVIANPDVMPKAIFVSTVATAYLQADFDFILKKHSGSFQTGINVLNRLVSDKVFLGVSPSYSGTFKNIENVNSYDVVGPHPAGNVGIHINRIMPINIGEYVWVVNPEDVVNIGLLFETGVFHANRTIAIAGSLIQKPRYFATKIGASLKPLLDAAKLDYSKPSRIINGDVLTGKTASIGGYLGYFNNLVTAIPEGDSYRMLGWLPFVDNDIPSLSRTSLSWLFPSKSYNVNTNLNGEERALVVTGEMEKVFPMDIFPMQLIKACLNNDIERMEALGIYEVVPEDFALIDYSNTSKIEAQEIIRKGIELMIKEVG